MKPRFFHPAVLALAAVLPLAACATDQLQQCPAAVILLESGHRTIIKPGAVDPSGEVYSVTLSGIETSCNFQRRERRTTSDITIQFRALRAPSREAAHYTVPYFVALTQGERILVRRAYTAAFDFAPGAAAAIFSAQIDNTVLKLEPNRNPIDYQFMVGLEVSAEERAYLDRHKSTSP